jgi:hypothetical protein
MSLVPYCPKAITKNKKMRCINFCELTSITKALIPAACGFSGLEK